MRRTDRRAHGCFTAATPRALTCTAKCSAKCGAKKACGGAVGRVGHMGRAPCEERDESEEPVQHA
eukprot:scaffold41079_cov36-Phaeocystis_antarctica.AAC.1